MKCDVLYFESWWHLPSNYTKSNCRRTNYVKKTRPTSCTWNAWMEKEGNGVYRVWVIGMVPDKLEHFWGQILSNNLNVSDVLISALSQKRVPRFKNKSYQWGWYGIPPPPHHPSIKIFYIITKFVILNECYFIYNKSKF